MKDETVASGALEGERRKVVLVVGAGDATGSAIARRFAREGYVACLARRSAEKLQPLVEQIRAEGGEAQGFATDARKEEEVAELVETIEAEIGAIEVFVFNIGANVPCGILDETARKFFKIWEMACFVGVPDRAGRRPAHGGSPAWHDAVYRGHGALRGAANFGAFATAKHGLRALAQSMARELGPMNVHVAHVVIDGAIDTAFIRDNFPAKYAEKAQDGILSPDHIADAYWYLHSQPRDAWTFELDLRPWTERW